jgi:hypothetical protein
VHNDYAFHPSENFPFWQGVEFGILKKPVFLTFFKNILINILYLQKVTPNQ